MNFEFDHFHRPLRAAVIGASGGIGSAVVTALEANEHVGGIAAFARHPARVRAGRAVVSPLDITDEPGIAAAAERAAADQPLDLVFVATGILHRDGSIRPEKTMRDLDADVMAEVFRINALAPAMIAKHFLPTLRRGSKTVFAALSARVGSIGDNRLGGWASYRASKAALNMLLKTLAIEHARRNRDSIVAALHPGTVDTPLSAPFQGNLPAGQLSPADTAANHLLGVIDRLRPDDTGGFFARDGKRVPW